MNLSVLRVRSLWSSELLPAWAVLVISTSVGCSPAAKPTAEPGTASHSSPSASEEPASTVETVRSTSPADTARDQPSTSADTGAGSAVEQTAEPQPEPLYRIPQEPPELNRQRLAAAGIHFLESRRLVLLTDRDPETVRDLPALADVYFDFLQSACGRLRPSRSGAEFRAVGCLMSDFELFRSVGLVPGPVVDMRHGQQFGYRFWIRDQAEDYYRRHLLLHEFAHVYMTCDTGLQDIPDGWFMEGAAEVFATHTVAGDLPEFGLLPQQLEVFEGWGRISAIRRHRVDRVPPEFTLQTIPTMEQVRFPRGEAARDDVRYAWWWALSWMLRNHPDYADDWDRLCRSRGADEFGRQVKTMDARCGPRLSTDWLLFAESLCESFDRSRGFPLHREPEQASPAELTLLANRSWQDTGWDLTPDVPVAVECTGRCVIGQTVAPWIAEPNGVTLEYNHGRPLGEVVAVVTSPQADWMSQRIAVGKSSTINTPRSGRLWLQINDSAGALADNSGSFHVTIRRMSAVADSGQ